MLIKVIKGYRNIVTICDSDLLGKKFEEGKFQLEIKEDFFKGKEVIEEEAFKIIEKMLKEDSTFNIVGEKSINFALRKGLICKEGIKKIQGIPFSLILL